MTSTRRLDRFVDIMDLEPHGTDVFLGECPVYPWGRVYGGQVVAQALKAALETVDPEHRPHSLHGYFIRGGTSDEPIRFEVERIRNGRSFLTRRVVARQSNGAIFNMSASFHVEEGTVDVSPSAFPVEVPGPDELPDDSWTSVMTRRPIPRARLGGRTGVWIKVHEVAPDRRVDQTLALAYASDDVPYDAAASVLPDRADAPPDDMAHVGASLDHALWFHRPVTTDGWLLHLLQPMSYAGNRGLAFGQIFDEAGRHLASVAQEIVLRPNRAAGQEPPSAP